MAAGYPAQKMIFVKKGMPADIVAALRKAAADTINEPGFKEAAAKTIGNYPQAVGAKAEVLKKNRDDGFAWIKSLVEAAVQRRTLRRFMPN